MNIIISNKCEAILNALNIDVLERVNGTFSAEELAERFKTTFFNKMIIDITAIKDYENINNIQKLNIAFNSEKLILLLDDSLKVNDSIYLSQLVSMGLYNFTKDVKEIEYLISNPNTYKDVASYHMLNMTNEDIEESKRAREQASTFAGQKVIGVVNLTSHAGATTLSYLMAKHLRKLYKAKAVELNTSDFTYFKESELLDSISSDNLKEYLNNNSSSEAIVIDIGEDNKEAKSYCTDIIYLIEPGLIQLNKLIGNNRHIFEEMYDKKIVLNRSILNIRDIEDFERESGCKIFFNVPNIDDKLDNIKSVKELLLRLGFTRFSSETKSSVLDFFGKM